MNQKNGKNSLGIDKCFEETNNPIELFEKWFEKAKEHEINDPNALALATSNHENQPNVRMVLLKGLSSKGFVFYTNFKSQKGKEIELNKKASMCFHWKSLRRQVRILGNLEKVTDKEADEYYNTRPYANRIGAFCLILSIDSFRKVSPLYEDIRTDINGAAILFRNTSINGSCLICKMAKHERRIMIPDACNK